VWNENTNFPNWERMRLIIEKEKAYYWKPVRKKKNCLVGLHFKRDFTSRKSSACLTKINIFHNVSGSSCTVSWGPIRIPSMRFVGEMSSYWTQMTCDDYHVAGNRRGEFLTRPVLVRSRLWTVYLHCSNEEVSRLWTRSGNAGICWPWCPGGLIATKHTEMTRSYVLKRVFANEAWRNVF